MGWGVAQEETFPALVARATGRRVLNAAVSSYGTVREMRLLERIDRRRLAWLIVQYNANDVGENRLFHQRGHHVSSGAEKFEETWRRYAAKRAYYPGKYAWESVRRLHARDRRAPLAAPAARARAHGGGGSRCVPRRAPARGNGRLRARAPDRGRSDGRRRAATLVTTLPSRLARPGVPTGVRTAKLLDVGARLGPDAFHVLDDHPNARGHRLIADAVLGALRASP